MEAKKEENFYTRKLKSGSCDENTEDKELECKGRSVCLRSISKVRITVRCSRLWKATVDRVEQPSPQPLALSSEQ